MWINSLNFYPKVWRKSIERSIFAIHYEKWPVRLGVRTPGFHPGNRGSIPLRATRNASQICEAFSIYKAEANCGDGLYFYEVTCASLFLQLGAIYPLSPL